MKKVLIPIFLSFILLSGSAGVAEAAALTPSQISAIIGLLRSFGADEGVVANVNATLGGTGTSGGTTAWCHTFNTNLKIGDIGKEVQALGTALEKEGFGLTDTREGLTAPISDDGVFIESTASAVTGFQEKYRDEILTPLGLKYGTGYVGKSTRAKLNSLYGCGVTKPPVGAGYLEIEPSSASIAVGGSVSMQAMYQPPMPKCPEGFACPQVMPARFPVVAEWTSSNPSVASVDVIGSCAAIGCPVPTSVLIKGVSNGTADIKTSYKSPSGTVLTATAKVVVSGGTSTNNSPVINGIPAIPSVTKVDQSVLFSWGATDADGDNLSWSVSWGDGNGMAGSCQSPNPQNKQGWNFSASHVWAKSGTYTVKATVNDCNGGSNEHIFNVTVGSVSTAPSITVLSPNGGEVWQAGQTYEIRWRQSQSTSVSIGLRNSQLPGGGGSGDSLWYRTPILGEFSGKAGENIIRWTIPNGITSAKGYEVEIGGYFSSGADRPTLYQDSSNAPFSIVAMATPSITITYPNGGEALIKGQSYFIKWAQTGFASDGWIQLQLRDAANSSAMVKLITSSVPLGTYAGSFNWTVPTDIPDGKYLIWATAGSGLDSLGTRVLGSDFSDAAFTISVSPAGAADASSRGDSSFAALLFSLERQLEELERILNSLLP